MTKNLIRKAIECIVDGEYGIAELTLREALAEQAEQEPVATVEEIATRLDGTPIFNAVGKVNVGQKLYAAPVSIEAAVLAEREACAKVADSELMNTNMLTSYPPKSSAAWNIAAAIRARGKK